MTPGDGAGDPGAVGGRSTPTLHTVGYEKRTLEELLELLRAEEIRVLVDVRDNPWSHKPGFSKRPLEEAVTAAGLEYVHAAFAGNPKRLRAAAASTGEILATFSRHLDESPEILDRLAELVAGASERGARVCLMCFERDPADCHRGILAARWADRTQGRVIHLDPGPPSLFGAG